MSGGNCHLCERQFSLISTIRHAYYEEKRKQKNKFYLLDIDGNSGKKDFFDKHWVYNSNTKNIRILCELKQQMKDD